MRQKRDDRLGIRLCDIHLGVVCPDMLRDLLCKSCLIVFRILHADCKGAHFPAPALFLHERDDRARINACREKGSERHIGDHLPADGCTEKPFKLIRRLPARAGEGMLSPIDGLFLYRPVRMRLFPGKIIDPNPHPCSRNQLVNSHIDGIRRRIISMLKIHVKKRLVYLCVKTIDGRDASDIGCKGKCSCKREQR